MWRVRVIFLWVRLREAGRAKGATMTPAWCMIYGAGNWCPDCHLKHVRRFKMPLIDLIVPLVVVGVFLWLINQFIPMASSIKTILNAVVVVCVGVWVLQAMGLWGHISSYRLPIR
jgi:hypothetical protein